MRFWIVNGVVHSAVSPEEQHVDILVENGRIAAIGKYDHGEKLDASGLQIYPGLVEAHCHVGLWGWGTRQEGVDLNEKNEVVTPELDAIDGINPFDECFRHALEAGVTTIATGPGSANVLGGFFAVIKTSGTRIDDMVIKRKAAMKCAFGENPKTNHASGGVATRLTNAAKLREMLFKAREYLRKIDVAGEDCSKRPDFNFKLESLLPVLRREIPLKAHAHQANDLFTAIRIAREFDVLLTLEHCTEGHLIADELAKEGFPVAVGPGMMHATKFELRNKSFATPGILADAGCQVSIITDAPVIPLEQLALSAGLAVRNGMTSFAALQAITINPAKHLGVADRVGSIEQGKDADLVLCDGSILDSLTRIHRVIVNGKTEFNLN